MNERFIDFYLTMSNEKSCFNIRIWFCYLRNIWFSQINFWIGVVFSFENLLSHKKSVLSVPSLHFILDFFFSYIFYQAEFLQNISENCAYLINNMVSLENISNFILYINIIYWFFIVFFIFAQITFKFNHHTYIVFFLLFETILKYHTICSMFLWIDSRHARAHH